jgi:hypothetical protein
VRIRGKVGRYFYFLKSKNWHRESRNKTVFFYTVELLYLPQLNNSYHKSYYYHHPTKERQAAGRLTYNCKVICAKSDDLTLFVFAKQNVC